MFVFKKYDKKNHVWSFMTKYLRFLCKFTSWSGETPTDNISDVFLSWTRIMSVLIGWPIQNTLTPHGLARLLRSIVYKYRILTSPAFQSCKYVCSTTRKIILLTELKNKMLLFFKYNYFLKRKTAITVFFDSYRKGKYRTFNNETEPSYAETHPKTATPTWIWWMLQPPFYWYDNVKHKNACKRNLCYIYSFVWFWNIVDHWFKQEKKGK
jgi:hypothetical protein